MFFTLKKLCDDTIDIDARSQDLRLSLYSALLTSCKDLIEGWAAQEDIFVLNVGAGRGEFLACLRVNGWNCLGVDPEDECVAAATRHGPFIKGDVSALTSILGGKRPTIVVCSHVLEHLDDPLAALRTIRATEAIGYVFAVPNLHRCSRLLRTAFGSRRADHPAHVHGWGFPEFEALLGRAAFRVEGW